MKKHTPAPWEVTQIDPLGNPIDEYANVRPVNRQMFGHETSMPIVDVYLYHLPEQQANARLIAAAPELLEALEAIINDGGKFVMTQETHRAARAAIAKARGAQ